MDIEKIIRELTLDEKIALCSGADSWHTKAVVRLGVPQIMMADGPHGLRKQEDTSDILGINRSIPATCFPAAVTTACSWDESLLEEMGRALGEEAAANGVSVVLGPGANLKRNPLCGRNFEYFSEDPYLTGHLAAAHIRGVQSTGVGTSLKHLAANSQEYKRFSSDSIMDQRTLREMYLTGFEIAVKEGHPDTVMCAYNILNGQHCAENKKLLTEILRQEWGFDGMVVTDWGAMTDRAGAFQAGCDLSMPGGSAYMEPEAKQAVRSGALSVEDIDNSVRRVLRLVKKGQKVLANRREADMEAHDALARWIACESAVLLKNQDKLLPLESFGDTVFLGAMAGALRYQGTGSSRINPWKVTNVLDACSGVKYLPGYTPEGDTSETLLAEAVNAAREAKTAIVFAGLCDRYESEGFDRTNMKLPQGHDALITAVAEVNPNTVVVLFCGSPVETPWEDQVKSILYMGLPGQAGGGSVVDLLLGSANPCGKLAESWPVRYEDCISSVFYAGDKKDAHYREGVYVGYRYYETANVPVRFPFGYGLSYTEFRYSDFSVEGDKITCRITNVGTAPGKEIAELYIKAPKGAFYRPKLELKGFTKLSLEPGETKTVEFSLDDRSFAVWNEDWVIPGGTYEILVGGSSQKLYLAGTVDKPEIASAAARVPHWYFDPKGVPSHRDFEMLVGHKVVERTVEKGRFTMDNTIMEMQESSRIMKLLYFCVKLYIGSGIDGKKDESNPTYRMMLTQAADASLSGMKINSGMKNYLIEGLLEMANGHFFRGIRTMLRRVR